MSSTLSGIQYYVRFDSYLGIRNPEVILLLLNNRWFGQKVKENLWLVLNHPVSEDRHVNLQNSRYHKAIWDDIDDSPSAPYRRARLRLEGHYGLANDEEMFALLEMDLSQEDLRHSAKSVTLSPVPFGLNGKPMLPYKDKELKRFLSFVCAVFANTMWRFEKLVASMQYPGYVVEFGLLNASTARDYLDQLIKMKVVRPEPSKNGYEVIMGSVGFENIFGIKPFGFG